MLLFAGCQWEGCVDNSEAFWNGVDFSECFRNRVFHGYAPILFLATSLSILFLHCLFITSVSRSSGERLQSSFVRFFEDPYALRPLPSVPKFSAPPLTINEVEMLTILRAAKGEGSQRVAVDSTQVDSQYSDRGGFRRIEPHGQRWKNSVELLGASAMLGLLGWRYVAGDVSLLFVTLAWGWVTLLLLSKVLLDCRSSQNVSVSAFLANLDAYIVSWIFAFAFISFFDFRTTLLEHSTPPESSRSIFLELSIFSIAWSLFLFEGFTPRYSTSLPTNTLPTASFNSGIPPPPELNASLFSLATFAYLDPFLFGAAFPSSSRPPLTVDTVPDLLAQDKSARVLYNFRRDISSDQGGSEPIEGLFWSFIWHFRWSLLTQQCWAYVNALVFVIPSLLLQQILELIDRRGRGEDAPLHLGLLFVVGIMFFQTVGAVSIKQADLIGSRIGLRLKSIMVGELLAKVLRRKGFANLSAGAQSDPEEAVQNANDGKIVNLVTVDSGRVSMAFSQLYQIWPQSGVQVIVGIYVLFRVIGLAALSSVMVLFLVVGVEIYAFFVVNEYQRRVLRAADTRLNLAIEVIHSLRLIKHFVWERKFVSKMATPREKELKALKSRVILLALLDMLMYGAPLIASAVTFLVHTLVLHRELEAVTAFVTISLINAIRGPLWGFVWQIVPILQGRVSLTRIEAFLNEPETEKYLATHITPEDPTIHSRVGFVDATFSWSSDSNLDAAKEETSAFKIKDLDFDFPVGKLSVIVGPVGSGKSTLLLSLLRETNQLSGQIFLPSPISRSLQSSRIPSNSVAYCAQTPWLVNKTVRVNILYGLPYDEGRYRDVVEACGLPKDLELFPMGDRTEVGERGIVVSGGQKARICLARAVYSPAKILLLDDVLSAVDSQTRQHLYEKCLKGPLMADRTIILVTHAVDLCLPGSSFVVLMEHGAVTASGPPKDLSSNVISVVDSVMESAQGQEVDEDEMVAEQKEHLKLIQEEQQVQGSNSTQVYLFYLNMLGGWWVLLAAITVFTIAQLSEIGVTLTLRYWSDTTPEAHFHPFVSFTIAAAQMENYWSGVGILPGAVQAIFSPRSAVFWASIYVAVSSFSLLTYALRAVFIPLRGIIASRFLYHSMIERIMGSPSRFYDTTPPGRILNRLSQDIETIDQDLPRTVTQLFLDSIKVASTLVTLCAVLPSFFFVAVLVVAIYFGLAVVYVTTARKLNRSESVATSPIIGLLGEMSNGTITIRAYADTQRFLEQLFPLSDLRNRLSFTRQQGSKCNATAKASNPGLSMRVEFVSICVSAAAAILVLMSTELQTALAGFLLSFLIVFNEYVIWIVYHWCALEVMTTNLERVREYMALEQESKVGQQPPAIWPSRDGSIVVENLCVSYAPELPLVLRDVSFTVLPRQKIGICGRTGSGKSTLALSLFRFIEPTSGKIVIDGLDISTLSLEKLREQLTMIPQDSTLFESDVRGNLDPFGELEDTEIWEVLRRVRAAKENEVGGTGGKGGWVRSLEDQVAQGGKNFSLGQRQLLSLARGILKLRKSSILILDESTASLDDEMDERIQKTIRTEMTDATILCIAHRLRTIIDYDKILVLAAGQVVEFGPPWELLEDSGSAFSELVRCSREEVVLRGLAEEARKRKMALG